MDQHFRTQTRWTVVLIAICINTTSAWAGQTASFRIPAGPAPQTLQQFYLQSQVRLLYLTDTVKGVHTHEVRGELEPSEALAQLLKGTGLTYEFDDEYSAVIKRAPHEASPGAGPSVTPLYDAGNVTKLQEILITGSLIHGVLDISSPLVVVDRKEAQKAAYATVQDVVRALPIAANITRGEVLAGTGNFGRGSSINLRGLGEGATLVLVNGRRQPVAGTQGDFVDVANLPWSMVDHIEVLPDGGSALYGSDAIAGVINIILRRDLEGAETQLRYGTARDGAAETMIAQLFGHEWESGHWLAGYQYSKRTVLAAADRSFTANADKRPLGGSDHRSISSNPGNILDPQTLRPVYAIPRGQNGTSLTASDLLPGVVNYRNQFSHAELLPDARTHNVYFRASQHLTDRIELFAEGRYSQRNFGQRPWFPEIGVGPLVIPATNPFFVNPFGGAPFVLMTYNFAKDIGPYAADGRTRNYSGTLGLKTESNRAWQASLIVAYGRESLDVKDRGQVDTIALGAALADPSRATAFNPFGDGSNTNPATLAAIEVPFRYNTTSQVPSMQLMADGPLFELPSGNVKAAIGAEYREEDLTTRITNLKSQNMLRDMRLGRSIAAAFTELSVPLIGDANNPRAVPKLELSLAGRYEHYSDFGRTFNPKIGLRWTPSTALKLRASWGTSFKAPNLVDLYDARNQSFITSLKDPRSSTGRTTVLGIQGGNSDLKEERASTWTAGFDLAPPALPGFQLSLTGYAIDYEDQVIQPGPGSNTSDVLLQEDQWATIIIRNPSQAQIDAICNRSRFFGNGQCGASSPAAIVDGRKQNLAITKVAGLDLALNQAFNTELGRFNIGINGAYVFHLKRAFTDAAPMVESINTVNNTLRLRGRGTMEWQQHGEQQSGFAASLSVNYTGGYKFPDSSVRSNVDAWTAFDVGLRYRTGTRGEWLDDTELALNVVNVLNEAPPFVNWEFGYDIVNARPEGCVIGASLSKRW